MTRAPSAVGAVILTVACAAPPGPTLSPVSSPSSIAEHPTAEIEVGPLEPGRYTFGEFEPAIVIEVGEGWEGAHRLPEFWDVVQGDPANLVAVQFSRPTVIYGPALGVATQAIEDALLAWPQNRGLTVGEPVAATVDDLIGTQVDLTNVSGDPVNVWGAAEGNLTIPDGATLRVVVLETDGPLLMISRQGPTERFDEVLGLTQPVFDSIRIGE